MNIGDIVKLIKPRNNYNQYVVDKLLTVRGQDRVFISSTAYPNFSKMTSLNLRLEDIVSVPNEQIYTGTRDRLKKWQKN